MLHSLPHPGPHFPSRPCSRSLLRQPRASSSLNKGNGRRLPLSIRASISGSTPRDSVAKSAIRRIADKLRRLGFVEESEDDGKPPTGPCSPGEIFIPNPAELPVHRVGHTIDPSWSTPENPIPLPGAAISRFYEVWKEKMRPRAAPKEPSAEKLGLPATELKRLQAQGIRLERSLKVGKAGITEGIVYGIHERWRRAELVKIKCEDLCRMNMRRTHEILERKTGGLVIWRSGTVIILYRGANYKYPYFYAENSSTENGVSKSLNTAMSEEAHSGEDEDLLSVPSRSSLIYSCNSRRKARLALPGEIEAEEEADKLLEGLGPRFTDWWGFNPLPVDADLLPTIIPGFRKPFRLLPFGVKPKLTDREMTILRRLGRPLPCHFALGRNRKHQGLASAMIKLWERCEIAKIAVKRGVQNTNSEIMAEELKLLTGGILLWRDKDFIIFYRGKDFLPSAVSSAIEERRNFEVGKYKQVSAEGFEKELLQPTVQERSNSEDIRLNPVHSILKRMENSLCNALKKKENAEQLLSELEKSAKPSIVEPDREAISEEEKFMLRKIGLRMKPFLLLGRRGVFDGTVENMHLHWKYRELVKIICKGRSVEDVQAAAVTLAAESGGILVAIERVSKGYAVIVYRGKNYQRPGLLRPRSLLTKKEALKRFQEAQRRKSLKLHVLNLTRHIEQVKQKYEKFASMQSDEFEKSPSPGSAKLDEFGSSAAPPVPIDHFSLADEGTNIFEDDQGSEFQELEGGFFSPFENNNGNLQSENDQFSPVLVPDASAANSNLVESSSDPAASSISPDVLKIAKVNDKMALDSNSSIFRAAPLSNRERLILRKQALKMRNRPVLAVGRNNVIEGVAKTIKTHFKKHPLAIVNIKGIAKGTPVRQVIFELEEATASVLVSREPSKVILYRGWGVGPSPPATLGAERDLEGRYSPTGEPISHDLLTEAVRLECGMANTKANLERTTDDDIGVL